MSNFWLSSKDRLSDITVGEAPTPEVTGWDRISSSYRFYKENVNYNSDTLQDYEVNQKLFDQYKIDNNVDIFVTMADKEFHNALTDNPEEFKKFREWAQSPKGELTREKIMKDYISQRKDNADEYDRIREEYKGGVLASFGAELVGGAAAMVQDPVNIAAMTMGRFYKTPAMFKKAMSEGALNLGAEAATWGTQQKMLNSIDRGFTAKDKQVQGAIAFVAGFGFSYMADSFIKMLRKKDPEALNNAVHATMDNQADLSKQGADPSKFNHRGNVSKVDNAFHNGNSVELDENVSEVIGNTYPMDIKSSEVRAKTKMLQKVDKDAPKMKIKRGDDTVVNEVADDVDDHKFVKSKESEIGEENLKKFEEEIKDDDLFFDDNGEQISGAKLKDSLNKDKIELKSIKRCLDG